MSTVELQPKISILPKSQLLLWEELSGTPNDFILYGGTALALRLGHRKSVDFDFFSPKPFDPEELYKSIPYLQNSKILQKSKNTLTCSVDRDGSVLVSFFGGLNIRQVNQPCNIESTHLRIASLEDLAGTKAAVIQKRAEAKDYLDIYAILTISKLSLENILAYASAIYGEEFNHYITLKAMCYFEEQELRSLPEELKQLFFRLVKEVKPEQIPKIIGFPLGTISNDN